MPAVAPATESAETGPVDTLALPGETRLAVTKTAVLIVGTRPEAIKMAPVHRALAASPDHHPILVSTGQHRELLATALRPLDLTPDHDLEIMVPHQTLNGVASRVLDRLPPLLAELRPDVLLVQGDTTTAFAAALAAYHLRIPVGHVEAGLRTYDHDHPFPEEANRQLLDRLATWCFAPTALARENLLSERITEDRVVVTGNTAVDALLWAVARSPGRCPADTILVTLHRRESFGEPLREIALGLRDFLESTPAAHALWPVHPNIKDHCFRYKEGVKIQDEINRLARKPSIDGWSDDNRGS